MQHKDLNRNAVRIELKETGFHSIVREIDVGKVKLGDAPALVSVHERLPALDALPTSLLPAWILLALDFCLSDAELVSRVFENLKIRNRDAPNYLLGLHAVSGVKVCDKCDLVF